jgi:hypothetical protein
VYTDVCLTEYHFRKEAQKFKDRVTSYSITEAELLNSG